MAKKTTGDMINILANKYFKGKYTPQTSYIAELNLLHSTKIIGVGGEQTLNDSNSKVEVGISDFNGTLLPTDAQGLIRALTFEYALATGAVAPVNEALVSYSPLKSTMPAWLLNSEVVMKNRGIEQFRIRVSELVVMKEPEIIASEWAKELEKTIKIEGGQDLQLFLNTPKGAVLDTVDKHHYVRVNLYGMKFADRKI